MEEITTDQQQTETLPHIEQTGYSGVDEVNLTVRSNPNATIAKELSTIPVITMGGHASGPVELPY